MTAIGRYGIMVGVDNGDTFEQDKKLYKNNRLFSFSFAPFCDDNDVRSKRVMWRFCRCGCNNTHVKVLLLVCHQNTQQPRFFAL